MPAAAYSGYFNLPEPAAPVFFLAKLIFCWIIGINTN